MIATWLKDQVTAGHTTWVDLAERSPYPRPALLAVAERNEFRLIDGSVHLVEPVDSDESWFPSAAAREVADGQWSITVDRRAVNGEVHLPWFIGALLQVPRMGVRSLRVRNEGGGHYLVTLRDTGVFGGSISRWDTGADEMELVFDEDGFFEVR